jgi:hypothetical protein
MTGCVGKKKYLTTDWVERDPPLNVPLGYWLRSGDVWKPSYKLMQIMSIKQWDLFVCLLHNIILNKEAVDERVLMTRTSEDHYSHERNSRRYNHATRGAYDVWERFKQYFNGVGAVNFQ